MTLDVRVLQQGEKLNKSQTYYGDKAQWHEIYTVCAFSKPRLFELYLKYNMRKWMGM